MSELPDIEVGRFALRTFSIKKRQLESVTIKNGGWYKGACKAECRPFYCATNDHSAPQESCTCGIYGSLSYWCLFKQFTSQTKNLVTVIAAEGTTIIGSRGLRTQYARVVAYWSPKWSIRRICKKDLVGAKRFNSLEGMLKAYKISWHDTEPLTINKLWMSNWWTD